jgi:hypothetical protein
MAGEVKPEALLRRVRLELARDHDFPNGSSERGYDFIAPIDDQGHIVHSAWKKLRERCRVKRFWADQGDAVGHIVHKPGGAWAFRYDIRGEVSQDEPGFHFDTHRFVPGEYVSIREHDGALRTFGVVSVREVD